MSKYGKIIECSVCKTTAKNVGLGLCQSCYSKERARNNQGVIITCSVCSKEKPHQGKGMCRACYANEYRKTHKKQHADREKKRRQKNPEKYREIDRKRNSTERRKAWKKEYGKAYYSKNIDKLQEYNREWMKKNKEKMNHHYSMRRSRRKSLPSTLTQEEWMDILEKHDHRCVYCNRQMQRLTKDHVIPASRGGGYTADNIVPACGSCNSRKNTKTPEEFREHLKRYPLRRK